MVPRQLGPRTTQGRVWLWLFLAIISGFAVVIALAPSAPVLQDYPDWVYQGVLFGKLLSGHPAAGYALRHYPVPNSLTTLGIGLLSLAIGWHAAAKVWLVLVLAGQAAACLHMVRRLGVQNQAVLPILGGSVIAGLDLWNGSVNFQLGLAILFFLLAHLLRPGASGWTTTLLLLLCFGTHMLPCGAGMLALAVLALQERSWQCLLPAVPPGLLAVWYALAREPMEARQSPLHLLPAILAVAGILVWGPARRSGRAQDAGALFGFGVWPPRLPYPVMLVAAKLLILLGWIGPLNVLTAGTGGDHVLWSAAVFWALSATGLIAAVLGDVLFLGAWRKLSRSDDPRRFLATTALALMGMFLLFPSDALGVTAIDSRFLHLAIATGAGLLSVCPSRRLSILAGLAVLLSCVNLGQFAAVQFRATTISTPYNTHVLLGVSPVAPGIRLRYYDALERGRFDEWIFPTAIFRQVRR